MLLFTINFIRNVVLSQHKFVHPLPASFLVKNTPKIVKTVDIVLNAESLLLEVNVFDEFGKVLSNEIKKKKNETNPRSQQSWVVYL